MSDILDTEARAAEKKEGMRVIIGWLSFFAIVVVVIAGALIFAGSGNPTSGLQTSAPATTQTQ